MYLTNMKFIRFGRLSLLKSRRQRMKGRVLSLISDTCAALTSVLQYLPGWSTVLVGLQSVTSRKKFSRLCISINVAGLSVVRKNYLNKY